MRVDITGIYHRDLGTRNTSETSTVREIVVMTEGQYPQAIVIQFWNENIKHLDRVMLGERIEFVCNIRGKESEYQGQIRVFNSFTCFGVNRLTSAVDNYMNQQQGGQQGNNQGYQQNNQHQPPHNNQGGYNNNQGGYNGNNNGQNNGYR